MISVLFVHLWNRFTSREVPEGHADGRVEKQKAHGKTENKGRIQQGFKGRTNTLPGVGLEATNVILWQRILPLNLCPEILSEVKFKSNGPILLLEGEPELHNFQAVPWLLLPAFIQIYREREEEEEKIE